MRSRGRRAGSTIAGVANSAVRTVVNVSFILTSLVFYYASITAKSLDWLTAFLTKFKFDKAVEFIKAHHSQSCAIIYLFILSLLIVPGQYSIFYAILSFIIIYNSKELSPQYYLLFAFFYIWFARTRSVKIKSFIFILFAYMYATGWFGVEIMDD